MAAPAQSKPKPEPMIEASGVTVARQLSLREKRPKVSTRVTAIATTSAMAPRSMSASAAISVHDVRCSFVLGVTVGLSVLCLCRRVNHPF